MRQDIFAALGDPTRRQLVGWLAARPATATQLAERLPMSRQAVAKHLGVLAEARLITREREGREVRFRLDPDQLAAAGEWIAAVSARWESRIGRLKRYLEEGERHGHQDRH
ncbi:MAG TPA: metalloregulator ArsR/SmtB family transcription factor [Candidatus Limnocylindria bacterium]|jgi:DNA-binding transcriptional ArsR family regulator|nr:metalloregulator ArsR/SmtB family transcription factor [Candidatus Limnocylindria bacterium]